MCRAAGVRGVAPRRIRAAAFPTSTHPQPRCGAIADAAREGLGKMMQVQHDIPNALRRELPEDAFGNRNAGDRYGAFRPHQ